MPSAAITYSVAKYTVSILVGIMNIQGKDVIYVKKKPEKSCFCNAGIYFIEPHMIDFISASGFFHMLILSNLAIESQKRLVVFLIHEFWIDVGTPEDLFSARASVLKACY